MSYRFKDSEQRFKERFLFWLVVALVAVTVYFLVTGFLQHMASDRAALEAFFETNDIPTEGQYKELIDSVPNIVDDYASAPAFTRFVKVSIAAPAVRTLASSPVTLVAAPGAGFAVEVLSASTRLNFVAPVFATNQPLQFSTDTATLPQLINTNILLSTVSTFQRANQFTAFGFDEILLVANKLVNVNIPFDLASGGSSLDVYVMYRIIALQ